MRKYYIAAAIIALITFGSYVVYFQVSQETAADKTALADIQLLQEKISGYVQEHRVLPGTLSDLNVAKLKVASRLGDYSYVPASQASRDGDYEYEICATFKTEKAESNAGYSSENFIDSSSGHKQGRHCFKLKSYAP